MAEDHGARFVVLFCAGLGMLLVSGANLLLAQAGWLWRTAASGLAVGAALLAADALDADNAALRRVAGLTAACVAGCLLLGRKWVQRAAAAVGRSFSRPSIRWGGLALLGVAVVVGSVARYDLSDDDNLDKTLTEMEFLAAKPPSAPVTYLTVTTDAGTPVEVRAAIAPRPAAELAALEERFVRNSYRGSEIIRRQPSCDRANCHGWVFTGGRFWVGCDAVPLILKENGYAAVSDPRPGDLAIYGDDGPTQHTAVVRYVAPGESPMLEGKWGPGPVYMHTAEVNCYGGVSGYYRSSRRGHILKGIPEE